jgi:hypothetical protein
MALRYFDGFDYYATADLAARYNVVGTATSGSSSWQVVAGAGRFGSGAVRNSISGGGEYLTRFFDNQPTWVVGVAYQFGTGSKATSVIEISNENGALVELRMDANNRLVITRNGTVLATGTTVLLPNSFYFLEFKVTVAASSAAHSCQARIGGVLEVEVAAGTNLDPRSEGYANRVALRYDQGQVVNTYDDFYVCDGTGSAHNDFLGDSRVEVLRPDADGHYNSDFAITGAASRWQAVGESAEDGDTSYVAANAVGKSASFTFPALSSTPQSVFGLQLVNVARKDDAGTRALAALLRAGGSDYLGADQGVTDTYTYQTTLYEQNPATSLPWTGSDVDQLEAGFKITR